MTSCNSILGPTPVMEKAPDTLIKQTTTIVPRDTIAELPKGTWIKTDPEEKTTVSLEEDTVAVVKDETPGPKQQPDTPPLSVVLPKNTEVILPENTYLQTSDSSKVKIEASSEVVLPVGTEISISKINWYAILFYGLAIFTVAWIYLQGNKSKDEGGD